MTSIDLAPGCVVLVLERMKDHEHVCEGLVQSVSLREDRAGFYGEPVINVVYVREGSGSIAYVRDVVHFSHPDWWNGEVTIAYEELPAFPAGVCRFCGCTERRACPGGCSWADQDKTVCSTNTCMAKLADLHAYHQRIAERTLLST
jgi:hypothetical protein